MTAPGLDRDGTIEGERHPPRTLAPATIARPGGPVATHRSIRTKFLTALVSSWFASPLAVGFAQLAGFANAPAVLTTLLALGALAPIQVLINEALVPAIIVRGQRLTVRSAAVLSLTQALTVGSVFLSSSTAHSDPLDQILVVIAAGVSCYFSTTAAIMQLEGILAGTLRHRVVALVAAAPGLLMLAVFAVIGTVRLLGGEISFRIIYATVALPAAVQCLLLRVGRERGSGADGAPRMIARTGISENFFVAAILFFAAASVATALRADMAARHDRYPGLLLVVLNATFSLSFTFSKIVFLEGKGRVLIGFRTALALLAFASFGTLAVVRYAAPSTFTLLLLLIGLQIVMTTAIGTTRKTLHGGA